MLSIFILVSSVFCLEYDSILVFFSQYTDTELLDEFSLFPNKANINTFNTSDMISPSLIVDLTKSFQFFSTIENLCEFYNTYYLTTTIDNENSYSARRFYTLPDPTLEAEKLTKFIHFLNWTTFTLISFSSYTEIKTSNLIEKNFLANCIVYHLQENMSDEDFDRFTKRIIKSSGETNFAIIGYGPGITKLQNFIIKRKANKPNLTFIYQSLAINQVFIENSYILGLPSTQSSQSYFESIYLSTKHTIDQFLLFPFQKFKLECPNQICSNDFNIFRIISSQKQIIGNIIDSPFLTNKSENFQNELLKNSEILIFIANGTSELGQENFFLQTSYFYLGSLYSIHQANQDLEIKGFSYKTQMTDCGNLIYNEEWYLQCFSKLAKLSPIGFLTGLYLTGAYGNALTLRKLGIKLPQVSAFSNSELLDNSENFPEYFSLSPTAQEYMATGLNVILSTFNWKSFILFITPDFLENYIQLLGGTSLQEAKVLNPENLRIFPLNYSRSDFKEYEDYFLFALKSKCRLFNIICNNPGPILEGLYDVGF